MKKMVGHLGQKYTCMISSGNRVKRGFQIKSIAGTSGLRLLCCGADKHVDPTNDLSLMRASNDSQRQ